MWPNVLAPLRANTESSKVANCKIAEIFALIYSVSSSLQIFQSLLQSISIFGGRRDFCSIKRTFIESICDQGLESPKNALQAIFCRLTMNNCMADYGCALGSD